MEVTREFNDAIASSEPGFTIRVGKSPLHEWSAWGRNLYLITSPPPVGFELAILASQRLQSHAFDRDRRIALLSIVREYLHTHALIFVCTFLCFYRSYHSLWGLRSFSFHYSLPVNSGSLCVFITRAETCRSLGWETQLLSFHYDYNFIFCKINVPFVKSR
jgi:hypothetical protein